MPNSLSGNSLFARPIGYPRADLVVSGRRRAFPETVRAMIADTGEYDSCQRCFRLGVGDQVSAGKTPRGRRSDTDFTGRIEHEGFQVLPISAEHGIRAGLLPRLHKDPFDRMLIAQSQAENIPIISNETVFGTYGVRRLW